MSHDNYADILERKRAGDTRPCAHTYADERKQEIYAQWCEYHKACGVPVPQYPWQAYDDTAYALWERVLKAHERKPTKYRVVYYTTQGCRSRDYPAEQEAQARAFYDRHKAAHPEYQDRDWSRTELVPIYAE